MIRTRYIAVASLFFTLAFFIEYTPTFHNARRVHIPFDLEAYHYPLADYAYQSIHQGRFPQWDPTIYTGLNFTGNIQAALFYPPTGCAMKEDFTYWLARWARACSLLAVT
jgi:hypothetical protein